MYFNDEPYYYINIVFAKCAKQMKKRMKMNIYKNKAKGVKQKRYRQSERIKSGKIKTCFSKGHVSD